MNFLSATRTTLISIFFVFISSELCNDSAYSHYTETDSFGNVGATLHIEPNDIAKAGKSSQAWFALTKIGGQIIPLNQCDCKLEIYKEPRSKNLVSLFKPVLKPLSTEGYKNIPSADITFPKVGIYDLELTGTPQKGSIFKPFKFTFKVTVSN
ncbi:hypothetical protein Syn7502_01908 [Synechococcus sp. PCC 7502]|uniref:hypothetical protein n=1 Tax=Synechococcus sp. PCC 7502 TaxID=1173263 RepID=UPI00029FDDB3|nr:hypothetical protein [Synechococcus sp. PCC 7502]AFY73940.1 hypothetical protein Syn7502_01908 [Synechococcus sp. PCC 7502]